MIKNELVNQTAKKAGYRLQDTSAIVEAALEVAAAALISGEDISLRNFGSLKIKTRPARIARNPRTGETVQLPERKYIEFIPAEMLLKKVNGNG